ncbi:EDD domain protein, DegV family [Caloramator fervidus]|uniref:EDD domain protein, DegV family n=1 Tax=Caloramator fervidus TaxID=29344 RepID=A0A1H5XRS8_9CLOT|nr:DegV family protein [Caloramator fervidus]SEG14421.1 EDD domain protein, DegV family [Caloramator fervidus]
MSVKILTDSTSYLSKEICKQLDIRKVSLSVSWDDISIKEVDINNEDFYRMMKEKGIPKSSQPSIGEMLEEMKKVVANGDSLVCVFISSQMSGTYSSALMVKEMVLEEFKDAKIEIIDSKSNCMQLGFAVLAGARAAKEGKTLSEVVEIVKQNLKRSRFLFIPDNLEYLKKGGRIGGAKALIGNILKIIPILTVEDGKTTVLSKVRTKKNAISAMIDKVVKDSYIYGLKEVVIHHINCYTEALDLSKLIEEKLGVKADIVDIGPVIGLHVGPGAIGLVYSTYKDMG